jgi:hypothetical protein
MNEHEQRARQLWTAGVAAAGILAAVLRDPGYQTARIILDTGAPVEVVRAVAKLMEAEVQTFESSYSPGRIIESTYVVVGAVEVSIQGSRQAVESEVSAHG